MILFYSHKESNRFFLNLLLLLLHGHDDVIHSITYAKHPLQHQRGVITSWMQQQQQQQRQHARSNQPLKYPAHISKQNSSCSVATSKHASFLSKSLACDPRKTYSLRSKSQPAMTQSSTVHPLCKPSSASASASSDTQRVLGYCSPLPPLPHRPSLLYPRHNTYNNAQHELQHSFLFPHLFSLTWHVSCILCFYNHFSRPCYTTITIVAHARRMQAAWWLYDSKMRKNPSSFH